MAEVELTADNVDSFKVVELRAFLTERGLPTTGVKSVLVARLREALGGGPGDDDAEVDILGDETAAPAPKAAPKAASAPVAAPVAAAAPRAKQPATKSSDGEAEARRKRAARFGVPEVVQAPKKPAAEKKRAREPQAAAPAATAVASDLVDAERLAARAKKFGVLPPPEVLVADERKQARAKRFQTGAAAAVDDEKMRARAQRFGLSAQ